MHKHIYIYIRVCILDMSICAYELYIRVSVSVCVCDVRLYQLYMYMEYARLVSVCVPLSLEVLETPTKLLESKGKYNTGLEFTTRLLLAEKFSLFLRMELCISSRRCYYTLQEHLTRRITGFFYQIQ